MQTRTAQTVTARFSLQWVSSAPDQGGLAEAQASGLDSVAALQWLQGTLVADQPEAFLRYLSRATVRPVTVAAEAIDWNGTTAGTLTITADQPRRMPGADRDAELSASPFPLGRL